MRQKYQTDLSDQQWEAVRPYFEYQPHKSGRPCIHPKREVVNAIFYVLQSGCAWRLLPHDFPSWHTVYNHFRDWQNRGVWEQVNRELVKKCRVEMGKKKAPSAAIIDSQSVKTTEKGVHAEDMMEQKKLKEEKGISSLIQRGFCSKRKSLEVIVAIRRVLLKY